MNDIKLERSRIAAAKPTPSQYYIHGVWNTLNALPKRKQHTFNLKPQLVALIICCILLAAYVAGPPLARAAQAFWQSLFSQKEATLEQLISQSEDERIAALTQQIEDAYRTHPINEAMQLGSLSVSLDHLVFSAEHESDIGGMISLTLSYIDNSGTTDPALIDFTLESNGTRIPMIQTEAIKYYRLTGDKVSDFDGGYANIHYNAQGVMQCEISFPYAAWATETDTDFVLTADINGQPFALPFTYSPKMAHAFAVNESKTLLPDQDTRADQELHTMAALTANAIPVGQTITLDGALVTLGEISVIDGEMHFAFALQNDSGKRAKLAGMDYGPKSFTIDGLSNSGAGWDTERQEDGTLLMLVTEEIFRDPSLLPSESLILLEYQHLHDNQIMTEHGSYLDYTSDYFVFYYDWDTKALRLPENGTQRAEWITTGKQLEAKRWPNTDFAFHKYKVDALSQTIDGITMTPDQIYFLPQMEIHFDSNISFDHELSYIHPISVTATVGGQPITATISGGKNYFSIHIKLNAHPGEWKEDTLVTLAFSPVDNMSKPFQFEFYIDPSKIEHSNEYY